MYRVWRKASYFRDYLLIMHPMQQSQRLSVRLTKQLNINPCKTKCHNSINLITVASAGSVIGAWHIFCGNELWGEKSWITTGFIVVKMRSTQLSLNAKLVKAIPFN
jgi:hypothetical protein